MLETLILLLLLLVTIRMVKSDPDKEHARGEKWARDSIAKTGDTKEVWSYIDEAKTFGDYSDFDAGAENIARLHK